MSAAKLSVSLPEDIHRWAEDRATRDGVPLSAVIAEALRAGRERELQAEALRVALDTVMDPPLSDAERMAADAELDEVCGG